MANLITYYTITKKLLYPVKALLFFIIFLTGNISYATCTRTTTSVTFPTPSSITVAAIAANTPTITPISDWYSTTTSSIINCTIGEWLGVGSAASPVVGSYSEGGLTYNVYQLKNTSSKIGVIMSVQYMEASTPWVPLPSNWCWSSGSIASCFKVVQSQPTLEFRVRFMRTGLGAGNINIPSQPIAAWAKYNDASTEVWLSLPNTSISLQNTSCTVSTNDIQVPLPPIQPAQLGSVGATAGSTPFKVTISCPSPVNVYMTMTDNSDPGQRSNIISAATGSTTQGVGVQVQHNGTPVYMGPDSSLAGNTNQFLAGNAIAGSTSIPFTASYIRTPSAVGAGILKAVATFTMSYQ